MKGNPQSTLHRENPGDRSGSAERGWAGPKVHLRTSKRFTASETRAGRLRGEVVSQVATSRAALLQSRDRASAASGSPPGEGNGYLFPGSRTLRLLSVLLQPLSQSRILPKHVRVGNLLADCTGDRAMVEVSDCDRAVQPAARYRVYTLSFSTSANGVASVRLPRCDLYGDDDGQFREVPISSSRDARAVPGGGSGTGPAQEGVPKRGRVDNR